MRWLGGIIAFFLVMLALSSCPGVSRLSHTCVICRLGRVDSDYLGSTHSRYFENECSRWYAAHVEPVHEHIWEPGTCRSTSNLLGQPLSVGCRVGHYPIWLLPPSTQMRVYQHFQEPREAKKLFASLTDEKTYQDRIDEDDEDRGHLMVDALRAWDEAGFPGTWEAWWAQFYARHVEEHREYMTWLHSNSDRNFRDWQERRKEAH